MSHDLDRRSTSAPANTVGSAQLIGAEPLVAAVTLPVASPSARRSAGTSAATVDRMPSDDVALERRVRNFLDQRSVPSLRRLAVEASGTTVVIRGTVRSYYEKQLAIHCCQRVAGVLEVVDAVEVSGVGTSTG